MTRVAAIHAAWRALPVTTLAALVGEGVLVLAPHPDDESLGCGGLIAACNAAGLAVEVAVLTDGAASHPTSRRFSPARLKALRAEEVRAATAALGLPPGRLHTLGLPDTEAPQGGVGFAAAVDRVAALARGRLPTLLAPWRHDPHCDHLAAHRIAVAAAEATGARLLSYPVWGWTLPGERVLDVAAARGWRLDVRAFLAAKRRAIAAHASQHGGVIDDDPDGFVLPGAFLAHFDKPYETYLEPEG